MQSILIHTARKIIVEIMVSYTSCMFLLHIYPSMLPINNCILILRDICIPGLVFLPKISKKSHETLFIPPKPETIFSLWLSWQIHQLFLFCSIFFPYWNMAFSDSRFFNSVLLQYFSNNLCHVFTLRTSWNRRISLISCTVYLKYK